MVKIDPATNNVSDILYTFFIGEFLVSKKSHVVMDKKFSRYKSRNLHR